MRTLSFLAALALVGCDGGSVKIDDTAETGLPSDDSAADDSSADDSAADDSSADDSGEPAEEVTLTFEIEGDFDGTTLSLTHITLAEPPVVGAQLTWVEVEGATQELVVTEPREGELSPLDAANFPGLDVAVYVPTLHLDGDGQGDIDGDEAIVGAGRYWVWFLEGDIPQQLLLLGFRHGWNAIELDFEGGGVPSVGEIDAIPLPANLWPNQELTFGGTYSAETDIETQRLVVVPSTLFNGDLPTSLLYDEDLTETWSVTLSGEPPQDHRETGEFSGAYEVALTYVDNDASGGFSEGDAPIYVPCLEDQAVAAVWVDAPTDVFVAAYTSVVGASVGWSALAIASDGSGDSTTLTAEQATQLDISGGCSLE
ncbi:MAG: hypothetical protein H6741_27395 [Alphaproteobacteria bacterium]|nr:hypothetical protein [Alphaproteobacteria bacterium]